MLRIIGGRAKGRRLAAPRRGTRPLTGRAREALFSSLGALIEDAAVLDLYAGSGSLGLEALSRGAASARFVERSSDAAHTLRSNLAAVGLGGEVVVDDVSAFLTRDRSVYDVVFVDPPYDDPGDAVDSVLARLTDCVAPRGIVIVHRRTGERPPVVEFPADAQLRRYGDATLYLFHRDAEP
jgi:16S rRNA (guanine966-N2)-methyltransferase